MLLGRIYKSRRQWAAECEALRGYTCDYTWSKTAAMLAALVEDIVDRPGFKAVVRRAPTARDPATVSIDVSHVVYALGAVLRQNRRASIGATAKAVGMSPRTYARVETGERAPTLSELDRIFAVVAPELVLTIVPRTEPSKPPRRMKRSPRRIG